MNKYLINRVIRGFLSIIIVIGIVMIMIYSLLDRNLIFANDAIYTKSANNQKEIYKYSKWEEYGYIDYVHYSEYCTALVKSGELTEDERAVAVKIGREAKSDSKLAAQYVEQFTKEYEAKGYKVVRLDAVVKNRRLADGGTQQLFAYKNVPVFNRLGAFFKGVIKVEDINYVKEDIDNRGLTFSMHDPLYGDDKISPTIIGNGTEHKYLLYFDSNFPYIHQNIVSIKLGKSFTVNQGIDVWDTMTNKQGQYATTTVTYPTGLTEESADDLHTATYSAGSRDSMQMLQDRFTDDYTVTTTYKNSHSRMAFSFILGIISSFCAYLIGVPLGILMARKMDKAADKILTVFIIFITAVPSLAYIFMVKAIGAKAGLPTTFDVSIASKAMYILPIISLGLASVAGIMKWLRRYMIDQMNSDYVKFARSGGLSEREIFSKHILKNAAIPIIHGIPGTILAALVGAIVTERVYVVPGVGNVLTVAINKYDNSVIVGVTLFYAILSVVSLILGDILISTVDPRISFTSKGR